MVGESLNGEPINRKAHCAFLPSSSNSSSPSTQRFWYLMTFFLVFIYSLQKFKLFFLVILLPSAEMKLLSFLEGNLLSRSSRKFGRRWKSGWRLATNGHTWAWFWLERILQVSPMSSTKPEQLPAWVCVTLRAQLLLNWDLIWGKLYCNLWFFFLLRKPKQRRLMWFNWIQIFVRKKLGCMLGRRFID